MFPIAVHMHYQRHLPTARSRQL